MITLPIDYTDFYNKNCTIENNKEVPLSQIFMTPKTYSEKLLKLHKVLVKMKHIDGDVYYTQTGGGATTDGLITWLNGRMADKTVAKYRLLLINKMYNDYRKVVSEWVP